MTLPRLLAPLIVLMAAGCSRMPGAGDAATRTGPGLANSPSPSLSALASAVGVGSCETSRSAVGEASWTIYDPDPEHLWNRLSRSLLRRMAPDGSEHGLDSLDPLLWPETTFLLDGTSHADAVEVLDEFLAAEGEQAFSNPNRRALLQRDLWAVFDWATARSDTFPEERLSLQERLAHAIDRLALPRQEILSLPDNLQAAVDSGIFPATFQGASGPAFLPPGLTGEDDGWVLLGRDGGPLAMTHTESPPFFGRSVFLVYLRAAGGREDTLTLVERLNERDGRGLAALDVADLQVALVRRAVLIDRDGEMVLSPLVESVQVRHFGPAQHFYQFEMDRATHIDRALALCPTDGEFLLFFSHGVDPFESGFEGEAPIPELCMACHSGSDVAGIQSILSASRFRFELSEGGLPRLSETTPDQEARSVAAWKQGHPSWQRLRALTAPTDG